ncbi:acetate--CoA ligase family protein [Bounagaea algeriensis]
MRTSTTAPGAEGDGMHRLLAPRNIAVFGGGTALRALQQCREIGFTGQIWPVNPRRDSLGGIPCYPDVASLPQAPDASFLAIPARATVDAVGALAQRGAGGAVCHASGFAESGGTGAALQRELVAAADGMPVVGPNCYGLLNYLDGAALWPDQHGGRSVDRGVAIVTQSGNIGQNLTMHRGALPLAHLASLGNAAVTGAAELVESLLDDPRITAIGLHLEGVDDVVGLSRAAAAAAHRGVPIVVLKSGRSELGAQAALSHTSSLASPDVLCDALFRRLGLARVHDLSTFLQTLTLLHVHGPLAGRRIASASCSGGEAALVADLAAERGLDMPELPDQVRAGLREELGERATITNPLDYDIDIWGDSRALTRCFTHYLGCAADVHLLVLDLPRDDRCRGDDWRTALEAFVAAHRGSDATACVVSSLPDGLPEDVAERLRDEGIAPMRGLVECLEAVRAATGLDTADGTVRAPLAPQSTARPADPAASNAGTARDTAAAHPSAEPDLAVHQLDECASKRALARFGVPVPDGALVAPGEAVAAAAELGYPVALKAVSASVAHKTEIGGVRLGLTNADEVAEAAGALAGLADRVLVETMATGAVAELLVGVHHDPVFGPALSIGSGGVLVELVGDATTVLLPAGTDEIQRALESLRAWPLLRGFRSRPAGDVAAVVDAVAAVAACAEHLGSDLRELDVNPLLVLPEGSGALAVDALIRTADPTDAAELDTTDAGGTL